MNVSTLVAVLAVTASLMPLNAQPGITRQNGAAPVSTNPIVEYKGVIRKVHISQGSGMPYLEAQRGKTTTRVYLGSIRYLIAENFNPRSGQELVVRGYQTADSIVAIEVTLPSEKKTLKLRDSKGWPLWRGGRGRFGRAGFENQ
jgi:hypothetical protein